MEATYSAQLVGATEGEVISVLLDAENLPEWNPALSRVRKRSDNMYDVAVRGIFRGLMRIDTAPGQVAMSIDIPGLHEESVWLCRPRAGGVDVRHDMRWRGMLGSVVGQKEFSDIPRKRVTRLRELLA